MKENKEEDEKKRDGRMKEKKEETKEYMALPSRNRRHKWIRLLGIRGLLVREIILEFFSTFRFREGLHTVKEMETDGFRAYWEAGLRVIASKAELAYYWTRISSGGDFLGSTPSYTLIREPLRRLCHRLIAFTISGRGQAPEKVTTTNLFYLRSIDEGTVVNVPYVLAQYLFRYAWGRKAGAQMSGGYFIAQLGIHFGVITEQSLQTLAAEVHELPTINIEELIRLRICERLIDTVSWVVVGPQRQQVRAAGEATLVDPEVPHDASTGQEDV
ncbi:hypothetical protein Tco_1328224 [Tanacetum coccineum]